MKCGANLFRGNIGRTRNWLCTGAFYTQELCINSRLLRAPKFPHYVRIALPPVSHCLLIARMRPPFVTCDEHTRDWFWFHNPHQRHNSRSLGGCIQLICIRRVRDLGCFHITLSVAVRAKTGSNPKLTSAYLWQRIAGHCVL